MARRRTRSNIDSGLCACTFVLAGCGPAPEASRPAVTSVDAPPPPSASAVVSVPASAAATLPARTAKPLELPPSVCTVKSLPRRDGTGFGLGALFVAGHRIGHAGALGDVREVTLGFAEPKAPPADVPKGPVARASAVVVGSAVTLRGAVPTSTGTTDDLRLYPVTQVVRDGWLHYEQLEVESADAGGVAPKTELPAWITPKSLTTFTIPCSELSVFAGKQTEVLADSAIAVPFTLEDDAGRAVASFAIDKRGANAREPLPVQRLGSKGGRAQIRYAITSVLYVEGWVPAKLVKAREWGGLGYGTGSGSLPATSVIQCTRDVPLWVNAKGGPYDVGTLHPNSEQYGWASEYGYHINLQGGDNDATPYVPEHELGACTITKRERKPRK